jgi:hypothetical protein
MRRQAVKKDELAESVKWVAKRREMIVFRRGRKPVAALVPIRDAKLVEALEDAIDLREARKALKERVRIPWEKVKKDLGL